MRLYWLCLKLPSTRFAIDQQKAARLLGVCFTEKFSLLYLGYHSKIPFFTYSGEVFVCTKGLQSSVLTAFNNSSPVEQCTTGLRCG